MTTPLLQYVARFDGGGEIGGGYIWCSLFVGYHLLRQAARNHLQSGRSIGVVAVCTRISSQEHVYISNPHTCSSIQ